MRMSQERQYQPPTFMDVNLYLKAFFYLYQDLMSDFNIKEQDFSTSTLADINHKIEEAFSRMTLTQAYLRNKLIFYDVQVESEQISIRNLQAIMKLPFSLQKQLIEKPSIRRKSYVPRDRHRGPYRTYSIQEKNHVVYLSNQGMKFAAISKRLGIPQKNIVRWCKDGYIIREVRRKSDAEMEEALILWIQQKRQTAEVRSSEIQSKARAMSSNPYFKASRGWLKNFLIRLDKFQAQAQFQTQVLVKKQEE